MIGDRGRGVVLYALSLGLLLAGVLWYVGAAPELPGLAADDGRVTEWRARAEEALHELQSQVGGDTAVLRSGSGTERRVEVEAGSYRLMMICFGERGAVRVRVSSTGNDSGRAVPCSDAPSVATIRVAVADEFFLNMEPEIGAGASVVFRWRLDRAGGF